MTISIIRTDMTADEKPEASHDYNFYLDRQLQNKLLEQDDILEASELYAKLTGATDNKNLTTKAAFAKADAIIGWINDSKVVLRKPDREANNSNSRNSNPIPNGYQMWKDARNKNLQDSYVFKHYYDTHGYIEQYRRDHTNVFIYRSPTSIQNMQGEGVHRYSQQNSNPPSVTSQVSHQQTTPVCSHCNSSNSMNSVPNYLAALQYTNRCSSIIGGGSPYTHSPYSCYHTSQTSGGQSVYSHQTNSNRPSAHGSHSSLSQRNSSHQKHSHQPSSSCRKHKHQVDSASQAFKYKLAPETYWGNTVTRSESQNSLESDKTSTSSGADAKTSRVGSAKGGKTPTKVTVPAIQNQIQTVSVQNTQVRASETPISTTVRALDTLACVAGDKQQQTQRRGFSGNFAKKMTTASGTESLEDDLGMFVSDDGSDDFLYSDLSDAISISQLSTACLGADVRVKRDTEDLEPSCTFHVFPNEYALDNTLSVLNTRSVTWYPASSSVPSTPKPPKKEWNSFQASLKNYKREIPKEQQSGPSENNRNISSRVSRDTSVKRTQNEGKLELPLIMNDSKVGRLVASDIQLLDQVFFNNDKKDESKEEEKESLMRRPRTEKHKLPKYVPEGKARQMKGLRQKFSGYVFNSRSNLRKTASAPNCATNGQMESENTSEKQSVKDPSERESPKPEIPIPSPILRYLKSSVEKERPTQSSQSQRSTSSKRRLADQKSLEKVAEYLLSERNILIGGSPREPPGIKTDIPASDGKSKVEHPHTEGMTWCEKLELLRSVNKRKEKPKMKIPKLTYYKDSEDNPLPAPLVREATRAQLYEQRRIKHLLQQARMKGLNQLDWLKEHDSQRFRHSGSTDSSSESELDTSNDESEGRISRHLSNCRMGYNDGVLLSRYNMKKSVKGDNRKAVPSINRTNTEIFQD